MAVYIIEPRQQQPVLSIIPFAIILLGRSIPDIGDHAILHTDILSAPQRKLLIQQINITK